MTKHAKLADVFCVGYECAAMVLSFAGYSEQNTKYQGHTLIVICTRIQVGVDYIERRAPPAGSAKYVPPLGYHWSKVPRGRCSLHLHQTIVVTVPQVPSIPFGCLMGRELAQCFIIILQSWHGMPLGMFVLRAAIATMFYSSRCVFSR